MDDFGYTGKSCRVPCPPSRYEADAGHAEGPCEVTCSPYLRGGWRISCCTTQSSQERAWRAHMDAEKKKKPQKVTILFNSTSAKKTVTNRNVSNKWAWEPWLARSLLNSTGNQHALAWIRPAANPSHSGVGYRWHS